MNKLKKLKLASAIAFSLLSIDVYADIIELDDSTIRTISAVGKITVTHEDGFFFVRKKDMKFSVGRENLDPLLRDITGDQLNGFTKANNYLQVTEFSEGEFKLDSKVRTPGGMYPPTDPTGPTDSITKAIIDFISKILTGPIRD